MEMHQITLPEIETHWIGITYVLVGIGLYGGYRGWGAPFRLLYFCVFPVHWAVISYWTWRERNPTDARHLNEWIGVIVGRAITTCFALAVIWFVLYVLADSFLPGFRQ